MANSKHRTPKAEASAIQPTLHASAEESPRRLEEEIRRHAYELYEQRGRQDGFAEEDWLEAEKEVLNRQDTMAA